MSERKVDSLTNLFYDKAVFVHMGGTMSKDEELEIIQKRQDSLQRRGYPGSVGAVYWCDDCHPFEQNSLVAVVGGNEVTNPFVVTEVYVQRSGTWNVSLALVHQATYPVAIPLTTENQGENYANCKIEQWR